MLCVLVFVGWGHAWVDGANQLAKLCYYDCKSTKTGGWYDRVYRVDHRHSCPARFGDS